MAAPKGAQGEDGACNVALFSSLEDSPFMRKQARVWQSSRSAMRGRAGAFGAERRRFCGVLTRSTPPQLSLLEEGVGDLRQRSALLTKARARGCGFAAPRSAR